MSKAGLSDDDLVEADNAPIDQYNAEYFGPYIENNAIFTVGIMCPCCVNDAQELIYHPNDISEEKAVELLGKELYQLIFNNPYEAEI